MRRTRPPGNPVPVDPLAVTFPRTAEAGPSGSVECISASHEAVPAIPTVREPTPFEPPPSKTARPETAAGAWSTEAAAIAEPAMRTLGLGEHRCRGQDGRQQTGMDQSAQLPQPMNIGHVQ